MIKVKATNEFSKRGIKLAETGRIMHNGEEFLVSEERFKVLNGRNKYGAIFVIPVRNANGDIIKQADTIIPATMSSVQKTEIKIPEVVEEPDIFVIEPGKEPVKVDKNLNPIKKKYTKKAKTTE